MNERHVLISGGAGYIGAYLTGDLLRAGYKVTVIDDLLYGGESLLSYFPHPEFAFVKADVSEPRAVKTKLRGDWPVPDTIIHLAAIAGFPACQAVGRQVAWRYNVTSTENVFDQAVEIGSQRFIYISTYSNYGLSPNGEPLTETSPLNPQSLYAETKVTSERFLLGNADAPCAPLILRPATLYGLSPRPRFDLIVNQFVYDAYFKRELMIYQRGYSRSFLHIDDAVKGIRLVMDAPVEEVSGEVFNVGTDDGNLTKDEVVNFVLKRLPESEVHYKDITFGGDMRDIKVSFAKFHDKFNFNPKYTVDDGVKEVLHALRNQIIRDPHDWRYRNARFIVQ